MFVIRIKIVITSLLIYFAISLTFAEERDSVQHIQKLEIEKKKKRTFAVKQRDSTIVLNIDTLIMKDRATLEFFGKKKVRLNVKYAVIPKEAYIVGTDSKNNGSDMDIDIRFESLGKLYILAGGRDANNGSRTHPNGNGGNVNVRYDQSGLTPQQENKNKTNYLRIDTRAGGYRVNPQTDLYNIYTQIGMGIRTGAGRLGGVPQGQIYSGSPGRDGKSEVVGY